MATLFFLTGLISLLEPFWIIALCFSIYGFRLACNNNNSNNNNNNNNNWLTPSRIGVLFITKGDTFHGECMSINSFAAGVCTLILFRGWVVISTVSRKKKKKKCLDCQCQQ